MNAFTDPRSAPRNTIAATVLLLGAAVGFSINRIATVTYESGNGSIAQYRANSCRVLNAPDKLELGAYYLQPTEGNRGVLLDEGTYLCDSWGNTGRIERGGYLQQIKTGDATPINKTLMMRIEDPANPDHNSQQRIQRDISRAPYVEPTPTSKPSSTLFQIP